MSRRLTENAAFLGTWSSCPQDRSSAKCARRTTHSITGSRAIRKSAVCLSCTNTPIMYWRVMMGRMYTTRSLPVGQVFPFGSIIFPRSLGGQLVRIRSATKGTPQRQRHVESGGQAEKRIQSLRIPLGARCQLSSAHVAVERRRIVNLGSANMIYAEVD